MLYRFVEESKSKTTRERVSETPSFIKSAIMRQENTKLADRDEVQQMLIPSVNNTSESSLERENVSEEEREQSLAIFGRLGYDKKEDSFFEGSQSKSASKLVTIHQNVTEHSFQPAEGNPSRWQCFRRCVKTNTLHISHIIFIVDQDIVGPATDELLFETFHLIKEILNKTKYFGWILIKSTLYNWLLQNAPKI